MPNGAVNALCDSISIVDMRRKLTGLRSVHAAARAR